MRIKNNRLQKLKINYFKKHLCISNQPSITNP